MDALTERRRRRSCARSSRARSSRTCTRTTIPTSRRIRCSRAFRAPARAHRADAEGRRDAHGVDAVQDRARRGARRPRRAGAQLLAVEREVAELRATAMTKEPWRVDRACPCCSASCATSRSPRRARDPDRDGGVRRGPQHRARRAPDRPRAARRGRAGEALPTVHAVLVGAATPSKKHPYLRHRRIQ